MPANDCSSEKTRAQFAAEGLEAKVRVIMSAMDCSHDWSHVQRVRKLALWLARQVGADELVVEMAALLHDVNDHKYADQLEGLNLHGLLLNHGLDGDAVSRILDVVENVSYSKQTAGAAEASAVPTPELMCVRDADRLDALGAVGIARCAAFTAAKHRPMYAEDGRADDHDNSTMLGHFRAKLFKLPALMHTEPARALALERVALMERFVGEFAKEVGFSGR